jgi:hypothetical protein
MIRNLSIILYSLNLLFLTACGGGNSASSVNEDNLSNKLSLEGIELYNANLKKVNGSRHYDINKFDGINSDLTTLTFDFDTKSFTTQSQEQEIFVDGQRNSFSNVTYNVNPSGRLHASINEKDIYSLELLSNNAVKSSRLEAYRSDIDIEGKAYEIQTHYLSNFFMIEKLVGSDAFSNLTDFTKAYENKIFLGSYFRGLVFKDNKLQELKDGNYTDAGSYEIKTVDEIEILMIYPDDSHHYYAKESCYVLSFSRVWKAKCYLKGSENNSTYYDKEVYDDLAEYLKGKFVSFEVSF